MQEMQQTMGILNPKQSLPELSEVFTKLFGGTGSQARASKKVSKVNKPVKKRSWNNLISGCIFWHNVDFSAQTVFGVVFAKSAYTVSQKKGANFEMV